MSLIQYIKDTRGELHHVAWPTRAQTTVFTALVITLSVVVSLYLGLFDYIFTQSLSRGLEYLPQNTGMLEINPVNDLPLPVIEEAPAPASTQE